ncbi:MAG: hypothetical protein ACKO15_05730, partial [Burkholderiales bacterium]
QRQRRHESVIRPVAVIIGGDSSSGKESDFRDFLRRFESARSDIAFRDEILLQQFYPCLTEVQKAMFTSSFFPLLNKFIQAKDVTWSWRDPLPFWTMTFTTSQIIWLSIKHKATFGEVATLDVGWYKETLTHRPQQNQSPCI